MPLTISDLIVGLRNTSRFSNETLAYVKKVMIKHSEHYYDQIKFWSLLSNSLMNTKEYARKISNLDVIELTELTSWSKNMRSTAKKISHKSSKSSVDSGSLKHTFLDFINGEVTYLSKSLRCRTLSKIHQQSFSKNIKSLIKDEIEINGIFTQISRFLHSYVSTVLKENSIMVIVSSEESNTESHIEVVSRLVNSNFEAESSDTITTFLDLIIETDTYILEKMFYYLKEVRKPIHIKAFILDDLGYTTAFRLPDSLTDEVLSSTSFLSSFDEKTFLQKLKSIFAIERTFFFSDTSGATWVRQVRKANELLNLFISLDEIFKKYEVSYEPQSGEVISEIKEAFNKAFNSWETLNRHSSNPDYIGNLHIHDWTYCLKSVNKDELGYLLNFNFNEIKEKVEKGKLGKYKSSFFERFTIVRHGSYVSDRWEGVIYDNIGKFEKHSDKSQNYIFRIRNDIKSWKSTFDKQVLKNLEHIALTDLRRLDKYFKNDSLQFLKVNWVTNGYETPDNYLKSFTNDQNNPLNVLKEASVKFRVIDGIDLLCKEIVKKNPVFSFDLFKKLYTNSKLVDRACCSNTFVEANIEKNLALTYLNSRTKKDMCIPRYSKSKGVVFSDITNENEKAAAIRVFSDLLTNSDEGRRLLVEIGFLSEQNFIALSSNDASFIKDWKKGIRSFAVENQLAGLPDGIIVVKRGKKYSDEFIIEIIGQNKGKQSEVYLETQSAYSTIIADLIRIACIGGAGKQGIVVYGQIDKKGNLVYTIIRFDKHVINKLKEAGAQLAIELNRPKVRKLLQSKNKQLHTILESVFYDTSTLDFNTNLDKFLTKSSTNLELYRLFYTLIKVILGVLETN